MEAQTSLVGAYCTVELYTIAYVYMYIALIVCPRYTEHHDAFGLYDTLDNLSFFELRMLIVNILNG